jgi:thymidylate synthase (FAD)
MPQRLAYLALHTDYSESFDPSTDLSEDRCGQIVVERLLKGGRGHYGPLEHPSLSLLICADHNTIVQMRTHRIGMSFDVQSMRYTGERIMRVARRELPPEDVFFVRTPGTYWDRQGDRYTWSEDDAEEALAIALSSAIDYARLRDRGVSEEQARQVLVTSYYQNAMVTGNLRSWLHMLDVRLKGDAQIEIRKLMDLVSTEVQRWAPEVYEWWVTHRKGKAQLAP